MNNNEDRELKKTLLNETDSAMKLKEETWNDIHQELFSKKIIKRQRRKRVIGIVAMAVVIMIVWAGFSTTTGQALIQEIKDKFVIEKDVDVEIEGDKEETHVELEVNENLSYVIYIDSSRYKLIENDTSDSIYPRPKLENNYPEVSMTISKKSGTTRQNELDTIKRSIAEQEMVIEEVEDISIPIKGTVIRAIESGESPDEIAFEWDTPVIKYYVTQEKEGQFYVIKQKYFLEAEEGHGVRYDAMLESFEVILDNEQDDKQ